MNKNENQIHHWTETKEGLEILADLFEEAGLKDLPPDEAGRGALTNIQIGRLFDQPGLLALAFIKLENEPPFKKRELLEEMTGVNRDLNDATDLVDFNYGQWLDRIWLPIVLNGIFWMELDEPDING